MYRTIKIALAVILLGIGSAKAQVPAHHGAAPASLPPLESAPADEILFNVNKAQIIWWDAVQDQFHYDMTFMLDNEQTDAFLDIATYNVGSMMAFGINDRYIGSFRISDDMLDGTIRLRVPVKTYQRLVVALPRRGEKPRIHILRD